MFCFFWLGSQAIIFSCQAKDRYDFGDFQGGRSSANTAKILNIIGFVIGGLGWLILIIMMVVFFTGVGIFANSISG